MASHKCRWSDTEIPQVAMLAIGRSGSPVSEPDGPRAEGSEDKAPQGSPGLGTKKLH